MQILGGKYFIAAIDGCNIDSKNEERGDKEGTQNERQGDKEGDTKKRAGLCRLVM